jgi:ABC-type cobalt transport system substrate-binding protein
LILHTAKSIPDRLLECKGDVGLLKILPFEKERLAGDLGEGIGEAITEIQPGGVAIWCRGGFTPPFGEVNSPLRPLLNPKS